MVVLIVATSFSFQLEVHNIVNWKICNDHSADKSLSDLQYHVKAMGLSFYIVLQKECSAYWLQSPTSNLALFLQVKSQ